MPASSSADRDPLDRLAEEFVARFRAGERPSVEEYAARLPGREDEVRDLFPALVEMEQLKPVSADRTNAYATTVGTADPERVGEFRVLRRVGVGGMGVVYEAVQESLGRHVALKLLPLDALADPKRLERFRREAKAAAKLHHTNIVPVFGTGEADGRHYYAMQFIAGHPLDAVIDEVRRLKDRSSLAPGVRAVSEVAAALVTGTFQPAAEDHEPSATVAASPTPQPPAPTPSTPTANTSLSGGRHYHTTAARLTAQVADALAYAHSQGILHRDIKPANLLLDLHGTVWVTDFGLAKSTDADDLTHAGDVIGTLRYMAPERFDGQGDQRADVYALGLTLYELLTLKPAFAADTRPKLVEQVLAASPPRPRAVDPSIPRDLETIVLKATARDPSARYASATEMADDLKRYVDDRPILARRATTVEQTWRWCRRNPAVAGLLAAVLVVFAAGAGVATLFARQQQDTAVELGKTLAERNSTATELESTLAEIIRQRQEAVNRKTELEREQDGTRRLLYASRLSHAQTALAEGRTQRLVDLLVEASPRPGEPDMRGWEWHYLSRLLLPDREVRLNDENAVKRPAPAKPTATADDPPYFCPDGSTVFVPRYTIGGLYCHYDVLETLTGRLIGQIPASGSFRTLKAKGSEQRYPSCAVLPSSDGKHALVLPFPDTPGSDRPAKADSGLPRFVDVGTGEESVVPAEVAKEFEESESTFVIGPNADWVKWVRIAPSPQPANAGRAPAWWAGRPGPLEVTCKRWDRATGKITASLPFSIGKGSGWPSLSPDGGTVSWQTGHVRKAGTLKQPWFECWDVSAEAPKRRFEPFALPAQTTRWWMAVVPTFTVNRSGTMAANLTEAEVVVYRLSDGAVHFRTSVPDVIRSDVAESQDASDHPHVSLSDDGNRVIIDRGGNIRLVAENGPDGVSRRIDKYARLDGPRKSGGERPIRALLTDGKTYVVVDRSRQSLAIWDTSRSRDLTFEVEAGFSSSGSALSQPDEQPHTRVVASGSRITLMWPNVGLKESLRDHAHPIHVWSEDGKDLGLLPDVPPFVGLTAEHVGDGRVVVNFRSAAKREGEAVKSELEWRLYTLTPRPALVGRGTGVVSRLAGGLSVEGYQGQAPCLVERRASSPPHSGSISSEVVLRDLVTTDVIRKISLPNRVVNVVDFAPTGRTYLAESFERAGGAGGPESRGASNPSMAPVKTYRLHLFTMDTGDEVRSWDFPPQLIPHSTWARFSTDGEHIVFRYQTGIVTDPPPVTAMVEAQQRSGRIPEVHLWSARLDGSREHTLKLPHPARPTWFSREGGAFAPNAPEVAVSLGDDVHVWNYETGVLRHRLAGHECGGKIPITYSADGSRLFTRDGKNESIGVAGNERRKIHVWDTVTGRELLTVSTINDRGVVQGTVLDMAGDKLRVRLATGVLLLDGTPVPLQPKR
jgi:serine/threonine protein kinase/WD40 repeat protein